MFDWLISVVSGHPVTYLVVFAVAGADVLMPILPAETVVLAASIIAAHGGLQVWILVPAVALGGFCGDNVCFTLGRRVGDPVARRLFRSETAQRRLAWASRALRRRGGIVIVVGRFLPGGRTGGTFAAGTLEMPWHRFARADAIAATAWALYVVLLGYFGGEAFRRSLWKPLALALAIGLVLAGAAELYRRVHRRREVGCASSGRGWSRLTRRVAAASSPFRALRGSVCRVRRALVCLLLVFGIGAAAAPAAGADVKWLCRPGLAGQPCTGDQTTRYFAPDGSSRVGEPAATAKPAIDCFYVYPTVSNQPTPNATQTADPEVRSIAKYQAQRFSTRCRVFAPLYRQVTALGVASASQTHDTSGYSLAFGDVREAWLSYLRSDNHGRGFVLIGHSQGSRMLRALIRREIDPRPSVRRRLVSAIIPGANATVAKGSLVGGDFAHIPVCTQGAQTGCVISYSTFNKTPPDNSRFGRTDTDPVGGALGLPTGPGVEVMCADPAALAGDPELRSLVPSEPFAPGIIAALLLKLYGGPPPSADTPWLQPTDHYTGRCVRSNGAHVLMLSPVDGARTLNPSPDDTWGTHLVDVNIALGNLTKIVAAESRAWAAAHARRVRALGVTLRVNGHVLLATVTGAAGQRVRVTVGEASRRVRLGAGGRRVVRFAVDEEGVYRAVVRAAGGRIVRSNRVRVR